MCALVYTVVGGSDAYERFLDFLGERILLKGWERFRGYALRVSVSDVRLSRSSRSGLDVKSATNGEQSLYTQWREKEIMFHVASMMPLDEKDPQQVRMRVSPRSCTYSRLRFAASAISAMMSY